MVETLRCAMKVLCCLTQMFQQVFVHRLLCSNFVLMFFVASPVNFFESFLLHTNLATAADVLVVVAIRIVVDWKGITTPTPAEITPGLLERMDSRDGDDLDGRGTA